MITSLTSMRPATTRTAPLAGSYTIDDYDLDPEADFHQLTRLELKTDGSFAMQGLLNGGDMTSAGSFTFQDRSLVLRDSARKFSFDFSQVEPSNLWMGAHVNSEESVGDKKQRSFPVTIHQLPQGGDYGGPLTHDEHPLVGAHQLSSQRFGECSVELGHDRGSKIEGTINGQTVKWMGQWMYRAPMIYINVGGQDTVALHKEHGGHGSHQHLVADSSEVDVIVNVADHLGEYNMTMT